MMSVIAEQIDHWVCQIASGSFDSSGPGPNDLRSSTRIHHCHRFASTNCFESYFYVLLLQFRNCCDTFLQKCNKYSDSLLTLGV